MSRRTDLLQQLLKSDKFGEEKEQEQRFMAATAELILTDFINIACTGVEKHGPGVLIINLQNDSTTFMSVVQLENDIRTSESEKDDTIHDFLLDLVKRVNENDWSKYVLITLISDAGTRTFAVEAGGSQERFHALTREFSE